MAYEIVTDSTCNLPENLIDDLKLHILPMTFMIDDVQYQSYLKNETTDLGQFYTMMREGKRIVTSLPNLVNSQELFETLLQEGKDVLYLGFSSGLSGTFQAINTICEDLKKKYPERTIAAVDTLAASLGEGLLVYLACQKRDSGSSLEEVAQWVTDNRLHMAHWFTVDDLMYLYKGGRVSKTAAFAGSLLKIKPVLHVDDEGHLIPVAKAKGRKKSIQALVKHMEESVIPPVEDQVVALSHADCPEDMEYLRELIEEKFKVKEFLTNYIDPVIGSHSGPGTLAVYFMAYQR